MPSIRPLLTGLALVGVAGCATPDREAQDAEPSPPVLEVVARGLTLSGPTQAAPGWTTIRLRNESDMVHFALLQRFPEGLDIADHQNVLTPIFQEGMNLLNAGDPEAAGAVFATLPPWLGEVVYLGGPGLTAAGEVSDVTVPLVPGTYLLECYVKTGGVFHSYNSDPDTYGMVHQFTVTGDPTDAPEPAATMTITISSADGFTIDGAPAVGPNTVAVLFQDQMVHENFVGHSVHLARLEDDTDLEALITWMDWTQHDGLQTPAPVTFLGGVQDMVAGSTGYLTVSLTPGRYAWIAEVPNAREKGMLVEFTVAGE